VPGISEDDVHGVPPEGPAGQQAHVVEGIRSLHDRIDDIERLCLRLEAGGKRPAEWLYEHAGMRHEAQLPAWRRPTEGEPRWPVALVTAIAIALQTVVPGRLVLIHPAWILPAVQGLLFLTLLLVNPHRINKRNPTMRMLGLSIAALLSLANGWSLARLAGGIVDGTLAKTGAGSLLITGGAVWLTNVIAFALWYWEFDRGGPAERALGTHPYPDFQFPQMVTPDMAPPHWEPTFTDYLYLAFTNASAFSPTDTMPLSRWAKMLMTVQSIISIITVALVVARAVNILQ
jgi:uncharacterized membrane protein